MFRYLDEKINSLYLDPSKKRTSDWSDLDAAVFEWEQRILKKKTALTDETLKQMAKKLFGELPQYRDLELPALSKSWLAGYRARDEVKSHLEFHAY